MMGLSRSMARSPNDAVGYDQSHFPLLITACSSWSSNRQSYGGLFVSLVNFNNAKSILDLVCVRVSPVEALWRLASQWQASGEERGEV
jgi:hypothetical protein